MVPGNQTLLTAAYKINQTAITVCPQAAKARFARTKTAAVGASAARNPFR